MSTIPSFLTEVEKNNVFMIKPRKQTDNVLTYDKKTDKNNTNNPKQECDPASRCEAN